MAMTQETLDKLKDAYANGAMSVEYDGKRVVYRTLADLEHAIAVVERELNGTPVKDRFSLASFRKG